jgi:hypothetical protein
MASKRLALIKEPENVFKGDDKNFSIEPEKIVEKIRIYMDLTANEMAYVDKILINQLKKLPKRKPSRTSVIKTVFNYGLKALQKDKIDYFED